jgi:hypothetical protein
MSDQVFIMQDANVRSLPARPFRVGLFGKTLEEALQVLIERHPAVIPGSQIDATNPPRFALLGREVSIGSWSVDHLLVDQEGVLTLVETKLAENPESRREVIGQVLEYAANAEASWRDGRLQERAAAYWTKQGKDVNDVLRQHLGNPDVDVDEFWRKAHENLRQGRLRILIIVDSLRPEVRRIIEYLNAEMANAEIYGLELQCYGDEGASLVLVPRLVGQTQAVADRKQADDSSQWSPDRLRATYREMEDVTLSSRLATLLEWALVRGCFMSARAKNPTFGLQDHASSRFFTVMGDGTLYWFTSLKHYPSPAERDRLFGELRSLGLVDPGWDLNTINSGRNLNRKLTDLREEELQKLTEILTPYSTRSG